MVERFTKMCLQSGYRQRTGNVYCGCKCRSFPLGELTALPKSLSWIWGALRGGAAGERKKREGRGRKGTGKTPPQ